MSRAFRTLASTPDEHGFSAGELAERKGFLEFAPADIDRLRSLHDHLERVGYSFASAAHAHVKECFPLRHLLPDEQSVDKLLDAQAAYFSGLTAGHYEGDYVANRLRIGRIHHELGLEPKWNIGAYRKYLSTLLPVLLALRETDDERLADTVDSLLKIVMFDMGLVFDSYYQAEAKAFRDLKNYLGQVLGAMHGGILVFDDRLQLRTINRAACDLLGLPHDKTLVGRGLGELLGNADLEAVAREVLADEERLARSLVLCPQGNPGHGRVLSLTLSLLSSETAPALVVQLQDETESVKAQQGMQRFHTALDALEDAIYLIDRGSMRFIDMNESAGLALGYTRDDLLGMGPHDIEPWLSREAVEQRLDAILATETKSARIETRHQRKDGATFPVEVVLRGFDSGRTPVIVAVARDISARMQAAEALRESEERFRATFQQAAVGIAHIATDGRWLRVNSRLCEIAGYAHDELLDTRFQDVTHPDDLGRNLELQQRLVAGKIEHYGLEKRLLRKDGSVVWVALTESLVRTREGKPKYFISVVEDISARRVADASLRLAQRALESSANGILITDCLQPDNPVVYVNPAFERISGYCLAEAVGRNCRFLHRDDRDQPGLAALRQAIAAGEEARVVLRNYRKDGQVFWNELFVAPVRAEDGTVTHFVGVQNDISEQKKAQETLLHMATHDALTGLPNRSLLQDRISQAIGHAERMQAEVAVLFFDIDRFKNINDSLGHAAGDILISTVAKRLPKALRMVDTVARVGGDEFVVVITDVKRESDISHVLPNLLAAITQPVQVDGQELSVTTSVGISVYPRDGKDVASLLKNADTAMYRAKAEGRNAFRFYTREMNADAVDRLRLENDLRGAIKAGQLVLHYQPQVETGSGAVVAVEALLRWQHPRHGLLQPSDFIFLAEETGLIVPIGEWALREVCAQQRRWLDAGGPGLVVAVNLSPRQFHQPNVVEMIQTATREFDVPPHLLELEITESSLMRDPEEAAVLLGQLNGMGFRLTVDDFGTGYSSLSYLKRFPLSSLKIDRSFVVDIESNRDSAAIATAVIAMAHSLGLKVVGEGVEKPAQLEYLRKLQCDITQGYLHGRPMSAGKIAAFLGMQRPQ